YAVSITGPCIASQSESRYEHSQFSKRLDAPQGRRARVPVCAPEAEAHLGDALLHTGRGRGVQGAARPLERFACAGPVVHRILRPNNKETTMIYRQGDVLLKKTRKSLQDATRET